MVIFKIKHHHKTLYSYAYVHSLELSVHTLNSQNHFSLIKFITHLHVHLKQAILLLHVPLSFKICSYIFF